MKLRSLALATSAFCAAAILSTAANATGSFGVTYFEVPVPTPGVGDFGICCSTSDGATLPVVGAHLGADGLPVAVAGSTVVDVNSSKEILWWTPATSPVNDGGLPTGITKTGIGVLPLPLASAALPQNMFAPNSTGENNDSFFETAILFGTFTGSGAAASLTVTSDDDTLVYLDGAFIGGNPGVHGNETSILGLGSLTGTHTLEVFYADRAQVGADLAITGIGLDTLHGGVPEPATWAMMLVGFGGLGAVLRRRKLATAALA